MASEQRLPRPLGARHEPHADQGEREDRSAENDEQDLRPQRGAPVGYPRGYRSSPYFSMRRRSRGLDTPSIPAVRPLWLSVAARTRTTCSRSTSSSDESRASPFPRARWKERWSGRITLPDAITTARLRQFSSSRTF